MRSPICRTRRLLFILITTALTIQRAAAQDSDAQAAEPYDSTGKFTLLVVGDAGQPGDALVKTNAAILAEATRVAELGSPLSAMAFTGDNFYPIGLNHTEGTRNELVETVLGPISGLLRVIGRENVHAVPGNHDYFCDMFGPIPYGSCNGGNLHELAIPVWTYHLFGPASIRYPTKRNSTDSIELIMVNSPFFVRYGEASWDTYYDSLRVLLKASAANKAIKWRLMFTHHPIYTFGEHGGYRVWDPTVQRIKFLGACIEDKKDPIRYLYRIAKSDEDICAPRYRQFRDSIMTIMHAGGAKIHALISGHEHSLQFLAQRGGLANTPNIYIISGAGSKQDAVRTSFVDTRRGFSFFSHPINTDEHRGESIIGFMMCQVEGKRLKFWFVDSDKNQRTVLGGVEYFYVNAKGLLTETK